MKNNVNLTLAVAAILVLGAAGKSAGHQSHSTPGNSAAETMPDIIGRVRATHENMDRQSFAQERQ